MKNKIMFCLVLLFLSVKGWSKIYLPDTTKMEFGTIRFLGFYDTVVIKYDTVKVIMLVCDTGKIISYTFLTDTLSHIAVTKDAVYWQFGYSVREKHNTAEGVIDPGFYRCYPDPCYHDYWQHLFYLDEKKQPLKPGIIVWQSVPSK